MDVVQGGAPALLYYVQSNPIQPIPDLDLYFQVPHLKHGSHNGRSARRRPRPSHQHRLPALPQRGPAPGAAYHLQRPGST